MAHISCLCPQTFVPHFWCFFLYCSVYRVLLWSRAPVSFQANGVYVFISSQLRTVSSYDNLSVCNKLFLISTILFGFPGVLCTHFVIYCCYYRIQVMPWLSHDLFEHRQNNCHISPFLLCLTLKMTIPSITMFWTIWEPFPSLEPL